MLDSDEEKRKLALDEENGQGDSGEEGEGGLGGFGGQGGSVEFRDFVFVREEKKLSPEQEKLLLAQHKETNSGLVDKQKKTRDERNNKKEGKTAGNQWGANQKAESAFLKHPVVGEAAEFSTVDPQMSSDPTLNNAETNSEKKEELVYNNQLRLRLQNQPSLNYKPTPY